MPTVTFRDETATGKASAEFALPDLPEIVTARELVRLRVREEVARHDAAPSARFDGLVRPAGTTRLGWERQADLAERAFRRNGFLLLVGDRQIEDLDETIDLRVDPVVSFIRLIALVGG
ncbi:hypothetical protein ACIBHY_35960 [Nonomuraea sp. NPDC050547]|uniref:hypothetical protein n=1 Tax=unclassified Nonomuraea TaxID=2593643 RepID=UPI00379A123D